MRASPVELLFDLVFVFTMTQLTEVIVDDPGVISVVRAFLTLAVIWWMFHAFVWLGNQTPTDHIAVRLGFICAMVGFLLVAISIPDAFGDSGLLFGVALLAVVIIHFIAFTMLGREGSMRPMLRVFPTNLAGASLVLIAGCVTGPADWILFAAAVSAFLSNSLTTGPTLIDLSASHFVERHGLFMIIAFGETIVSVGVGATLHPAGLPVVTGVVLCVGIVASLWWYYFAGDGDDAEARFTSTDGGRRERLALSAFGLDHYLMIFGVVLFSSGVSLTIENVFARPSPVAAWLLASGIALYLLADARYRQELALGPTAFRYCGSLIALPTAFIGLAAPAAIELVAQLAVLVAVIVIESRKPALNDVETH
ncbi:low temperature requirement protein A [Microbacterium sp. P05]|uniref:low temperature requirement protein A n=1 Tax=Microbacterium sp. P05 TaxID=3366948 RepID=UPI0037466484